LARLVASPLPAIQAVSRLEEAELLDAIEGVDRGEVMSAADLLNRLKT